LSAGFTCAGGCGYAYGRRLVGVSRLAWKRGGHGMWDVGCHVGCCRCRCETGIVWFVSSGPRLGRGLVKVNFCAVKSRRLKHVVIDGENTIVVDASYAVPRVVGMGARMMMMMMMMMMNNKECLQGARLSLARHYP